jgi:hypothetical protein
MAETAEALTVAYQDRRARYRLDVPAAAQTPAANSL